MMLQTTRLFSLFLTGLIAGTFFYGTFCVLPTFYDVPYPLHIGFRTALMSHNKTIVMGLVLASIISLTLYTWKVRKKKGIFMLCTFALLLTIGSLIITRYGSVPLNLQIKGWNPRIPPPGWRLILDRWDLYNAIRTVTSILSFLSVLVAELYLKKIENEHQVPIR